MIDDVMVEKIAKDVLESKGSYAEIGARHGCSEKSVERIAGLLSILGRRGPPEAVSDRQEGPAHVGPEAFIPKAAEKRSRLKALLDMVADGLDPQVMSTAAHPYDQFEAEALANYVEEVRTALDRGYEGGEEVETQVRERYEKLSRRVFTLANAEARLRRVRGELEQAQKQRGETNDKIAAADARLETKRAELLGLRIEVEGMQAQSQAAEDELNRWVQFHGGAEALERDLQVLEAVVVSHGLEDEVAAAWRLLAGQAPTRLPTGD